MVCTLELSRDPDADEVAEQFDRFAVVYVDERELTFEEQDLRVIRMTRVEPVRQLLRFGRVRFSTIHLAARPRGFFKADFDQKCPPHKQ